MKKQIMLFTIVVALLLAVTVRAQENFNWTEYAGNPVFGQAVGGPKAYYPSICYDPNEFSNHGISARYKMWYGTSSAGVGLAISDDGITWTDQGLVTGNVNYHCKVLYDPDSFGASSYYYKMWYADPAVWPYSDQTIRYAESIDGTQWVNDVPITQDESQPLITGNYEWWYGSYGPGTVLYHPDGYDDWHDSDPMGHKYVMYYDVAPQNCIPGEIEATALAYSLDGIYWKRYGDQPVLLSGPDDAWDSHYVYAWTVIEEDEYYHMWYSGGDTASHKGIGYAISTDGINWTVNPDNPISHIDDDVTWRNARTYTPSVLKVDETYQMWFSGKDSLGSDYSIGYATTTPSPLEVILDIIPGIDPNVIPWNKRGFITAAVIGTHDFDVKNIDISTIRLENEAPVRASFRDITAPKTDRKDTHIHSHRRRDGYPDLVLTFRIYNLLGSVSREEASNKIALTLTGSLNDGRQIVGQDSVIIITRKRKNFPKSTHGYHLHKPASEAGEICPKEYTLSKNYPNPFNPTTTIKYALPTDVHVTLTIYNLNGQVVEQLIDQNQNAGFYSIQWNAAQLPSGIYLYRIQAGDFQHVQRCLFVK
jgi:hypothetical protein